MHIKCSFECLLNHLNTWFTYILCLSLFQMYGFSFDSEFSEKSTCFWNFWTDLGEIYWFFTSQSLVLYSLPTFIKSSPTWGACGSFLWSYEIGWLWYEYGLEIRKEVRNKVAYVELSTHRARSANIFVESAGSLSHWNGSVHWRMTCRVRRKEEINTDGAAYKRWAEK